EVQYQVFGASVQCLERCFAGYPAPLQGAFIDAAKLAFKQAVVIAKLLLLNQAEGVIGMFAARLRAMNTRAIIAPLQIFGRAENRHAKSAANANTWTSITSHIVK